MPICFSLLRQYILWACILARFKAGSSSAARMAMIAITTSNSIKVKAPNHDRRLPRNWRFPTGGGFGAKGGGLVSPTATAACLGPLINPEGGRFASASGLKMADTIESLGAALGHRGPVGPRTELHDRRRCVRVGAGNRRRALHLERGGSVVQVERKVQLHVGAEVDGRGDFQAVEPDHADIVNDNIG